ncbi:MAG: S8 family serine peptidase [Thermoplasmatales archaeon]|nr:S8 family serine peptidase [Thermoplasmatales archaeon]
MKKNLFFVLTLVTTMLLISSSTTFVMANPPEKVQVIIGFHGKPDVSIINAFHGNAKNEINGINAMVAMVPENAMNGLRNHPDVRYVEIDRYIKWIQEDSLQWGVDRIDAEIAWGGYDGAVNISSTGIDGTGVIVAIVDTGIDYNHPDLYDNYLNTGYDFVNDDDDPMDDKGHGTHCAGIVAAEDNALGVIGVAPGASLMAVKVLDSSGRGYISWIASGITYAANEGADVISLSLGGGYDSDILENAVNYAYNNKGCVVVAAAGNEGRRQIRDNVGYPARYDSVIAVAATTSYDTRPRFSSTGPDVELAAPGDYVNSTYPDDAYASMSGTSMACPHVAGVAALVISSGITYNDAVRSKMQTTAEDIGSTGLDWEFGYGLVDAEAAVGGSTPDTESPSQVTGLTATAVSSSQINLAWTPNTESDLSHYRIYYRNGSYIDSTTATSYSDTDLLELTPYGYQVSAVDTSGNEGAKSAINSATTLEDATGDTIHVHDTTIQYSSHGRWNDFYVYVTIEDNNTNRISGAIVTVELDTPSGTLTNTGVTDSSGVATISFIKASRTTGTHTATVTDVSHTDYTYEPGDNIDDDATYTG